MPISCSMSISPGPRVGGGAGRAHRPTPLRHAPAGTTIAHLGAPARGTGRCGLEVSRGLRPRALGRGDVERSRTAAEPFDAQARRRLLCCAARAGARARPPPRPHRIAEMHGGTLTLTVPRARAGGAGGHPGAPARIPHRPPAGRERPPNDAPYAPAQPRGGPPPPARRCRRRSPLASRPRAWCRSSARSAWRRRSAPWYGERTRLQAAADTAAIAAGARDAHRQHHAGAAPGDRRGRSPTPPRRRAASRPPISTSTPPSMRASTSVRLTLEKDARIRVFTRVLTDAFTKGRGRGDGARERGSAPICAIGLDTHCAQDDPPLRRARASTRAAARSISNSSHGQGLRIDKRRDDSRGADLFLGRQARAGPASFEPAPRYRLPAARRSPRRARAAGGRPCATEHDQFVDLDPESHPPRRACIAAASASATGARVTLSSGLYRDQRTASLGWTTAA